MKKKLCFILAAALAAVFIPCIRVGAVEPEELKSEAVVVMDAETGQVLYEQNMNQIMYPASTTKILTGLLTAEIADLDEITTVTASALAIDEPDSANIALQVGEQITVQDGLYALMLPSANDAANVLAEHVAGSQQAFADLMNQRAAEIGAANTHFTNAHGLHEDNHYTTAYDMALITRAAIQNDTFAEVFGTDRYIMPANNLQSQERDFTNYQYMLVPTTVFYNNSVVGGKTGFTNEAMHTMSTVATRDGRTLICVVMYSPYRYDKFRDTEALLEYGFTAFTPYVIDADRLERFTVPIGSQGNVFGSADLYHDGGITVLLPEGADPDGLRILYDAPGFFADEEDVRGSILITLEQDGAAQVLLELPMEAAIQVDAVHTTAPITTPVAPRENLFLRKLESALSNSLIFLILALAGVFALLVFMVALRQYNLQKNRKRRLERMARRNRMYGESARAVGGTPARPVAPRQSGTQRPPARPAQRSAQGQQRPRTGTRSGSAYQTRK